MIQKISRNPDVSCINLKGRKLTEVDKLSCQGSVVTSNVKIQNEVNERIKKSQLYRLLKRLLRNKDKKRALQFYCLIKGIIKKNGNQREILTC